MYITLAPKFRQAARGLRRARPRRLIDRQSALALSSDLNYNSAMKKRLGRPPTGNKPRLSVRMEPEALRLANERAKAEGKTVGRWLEEAIREKLERERSSP